MNKITWRAASNLTQHGNSIASGEVILPNGMKLMLFVASDSTAMVDSIWEHGAAEPMIHGPSKRTPEEANEPPVDKLLFCPRCSMKHVDRARTYECRHPNCTCDSEIGPACLSEAASWDNPPHRTHLCEHCGHKWMPFIFNTNGVDV